MIFVRIAVDNELAVSQPKFQAWERTYPGDYIRSSTLRSCQHTLPRMSIAQRRNSKQGTEKIEWLTGQIQENHALAKAAGRAKVSGIERPGGLGEVEGCLRIVVEFT